MVVGFGGLENICYLCGYLSTVAMKIRQVLIFVIVFVLMGCSTRHGDPRLDEIAEMVSDRPEEALARLDSIDSSDLSEGDRHFYDFLTIKGRDKAYIFHTSDSLILDVLEWYETHDSKGYYPEALYYAGRVYSDMGDSPTALRYFQQALDAIPEDSKNLMFRSSVLSQTGRLLSNMHLYSKAIPYIEESNEIDIQFKDNEFGLAYNHHLLAFAYKHLGDLDKTRFHIKEAIQYSKKLSKEDQANIMTDLARLYNIENKIDSALYIIRSLPLKVDSVCLNYTLATAGEIYLEAGILDTAYHYAHRLINSASHENHKNGYKILFSDKMRGYVSEDTLLSLVSDYRNAMDEYMASHDDLETLIQNSSYNYSLHERERIKAENSRRLYVYIAGFTCLIGLLMAIYILLMKVRKQKHIIELRRALEVITILKNELENNGSLDLPEAKEVEFQGFPDNDSEALRQRLRDELMRLYECSERQPISPIILNSNVYRRLQKMIDDNIPLLDNDPLWKEIEDVVLESSPNFIQNLNILTLGKLTSIDLHTALLIKCDIRPVHMSLLMSKSNGAIVSRRLELGVKIFDKKIGVKVVDGIIRLL